MNMTTYLSAPAIFYEPNLTISAMVYVMVVGIVLFVYLSSRMCR